MLKWRLKWWQSGLLGAAIGLAIYYCQQKYPRQHPIQWSERSFFQACQSWQEGEPEPIKNIVIVPQFDGTYAVSCLYFSYPDYRKIQFEIMPDGDNFLSSLRSYAARYSWLQYEYLWWREPRLLIWAYPIIGVFLLGIVFPFLAFLWTGDTPPEKPYDLNRFAATSNDATPTPAETTLEHSRQLDAAIAAAEQATTVSADSSATIAHETPVRKLDNNPLAKPLAADPQAQKDFDGEFYPTEIHHHEPKEDSE